MQYYIEKILFLIQTLLIIHRNEGKSDFKDIRDFGGMSTGNLELSHIKQINENVEQHLTENRSITNNYKREIIHEKGKKKRCIEDLHEIVCMKNHSLKERIGPRMKTLPDIDLCNSHYNYSAEVVMYNPIVQVKRDITISEIVIELIVYVLTCIDKLQFPFPSVQSANLNISDDIFEISAPQTIGYGVTEDYNETTSFISQSDIQNENYESCEELLLLDKTQALTDKTESDHLDLFLARDADIIVIRTKNTDANDLVDKTAPFCNERRNTFTDFLLDASENEPLNEKKCYNGITSKNTDLLVNIMPKETECFEELANDISDFERASLGLRKIEQELKTIYGYLKNNIIDLKLSGNSFNEVSDMNFMQDLKPRNSGMEGLIENFKGIEYLLVDRQQKFNTSSVLETVNDISLLIEKIKLLQNRIKDTGETRLGNNVFTIKEELLITGALDDGNLSKKDGGTERELEGEGVDINQLKTHYLYTAHAQCAICTAVATKLNNTFSALYISMDLKNLPPTYLDLGDDWCQASFQSQILLETDGFFNSEQIFWNSKPEVFSFISKELVEKCNLYRWLIPDVRLFRYWLNNDQDMVKTICRSDYAIDFKSCVPHYDEKAEF